MSTPATVITGLITAVIIESIGTTPIQVAITSTTVPVIPAMLHRRWLDKNATSSIEASVMTILPGTTAKAATVITSRTRCATLFNKGATTRLDLSSIVIVAASGSGMALPPTMSRSLTRSEFLLTP